MKVTLNLETLRSPAIYCPSDQVLGAVKLALSKDTVIYVVVVKVELFGNVPISQKKTLDTAISNDPALERRCRRLLKVRLALLQPQQEVFGGQTPKYKLGRGEYSFPFVLDFGSIWEKFRSSNAHLGLQTLPASFFLKTEKGRSPLQARYVVTASVRFQNHLRIRARVNKATNLKVIDREIERFSENFDSISYAVPLLCMTEAMPERENLKEQFMRSLYGALPVYSPSLSLCAAIRRSSNPQSPAVFQVLTGVLLPFEMKPLPLIKMLSVAVVVSAQGAQDRTSNISPLCIYHREMEDCLARGNNADQSFLTFHDSEFEGLLIPESAWKSPHQNAGSLMFQVTYKITIVDAHVTQIATIKVAHSAFEEDNVGVMSILPSYTPEVVAEPSV